ncbi:hypothetical protein ISS21_01235 [Patescibacteria group bacterium]|nr:hypothetical protein [Patescibacteria group bacterium]
MFEQVIDKIKQDKYFIFTGFSLLAVIFWYLNFKFWHNGLVYGLCLIIYGSLNSLWLGRILSRHGFEKELQFILGIFSLIFLIGFGMAIPIVAYKVSPVYLFILLLILTLIICFCSRIKKQERKQLTLSSKIEKEESLIKIPKWFYFVWLILCLGSLFLLFYARTGEYIRSPWTVIHPLYIYAWLAIILFLGLLVFSKIKLKHFLLIIILSSLLLHAYLLIPYEMGFGGDKYRHIGAERWLMQEKVYQPALFGKDVSYKQFGSLKVPEVLVVGNKTSYANMWGSVIALSWLTGIDVFYVDLILGLLLFSLFLPFLILKLGLFFSQKKEFLYLMVLMPFLFYPFQAYGSITMPLTFALLPFLFSLIFICKYFTQPRPGKNLFFLLVFFIPFLYFNYLLYLILFLEIVVFAILIKNLKYSKKVFIPAIIACFILFLFFLPLLQTHSQYSWFKTEGPLRTELFKALKDFPVRLLSSQAIFPRVYGLEQDNWLYATVNRHLSRSIFLEILPWVFILTPLVWLLVIFGLSQFKKLKNPGLGLLFVLMLVVILINQMISSYLMEGNHLLTKRLVVFTSFLIFIPLAWGAYCLIQKISKTTVIFTLVLFLALVSTTVYASGPKFQVVTADEFKTAEYIWQKLKQNPEENKCVLANTWPLLVLEAVSGRGVVTGGFPYYYEYRQPERVQLFDNMNQSPSIRYLEESLKITGAKECYFITEERWVYFDKREQIINQLNELLGEHQNIGKVMIWLYQPNRTVTPQGNF